MQELDVALVVVGQREHVVAAALGEEAVAQLPAALLPPVAGIGVAAALPLGLERRRVPRRDLLAGGGVEEALVLLAVGRVDPAEVVVERPVLHHHHDDVVDRHVAGAREGAPLRGGGLGDQGSGGERGGEPRGGGGARQELAPAQGRVVHDDLQRTNGPGLVGFHTMDSDAGLLERERELAALERLIGDARDGRGAVVLIEGPAGIGKTRLLAAARERADGMTVLTARCSELEREFSFGAVRQLFEPPAHDERRERLLAGAAAPADGALGAPEGDAEGTFAVLHGLYWATLNLAEERPVLIAIDDLQWSDRPSLRFVAYLAARLEGAPVLVAASVRSTDPGTDPQLLAEIASDPSVAVRPGPLGETSVAGLIHDRLGDADPRFTSACVAATGGNPLLLRHVLTALAEDGVRPTAAGAVAVRGIGSRAVSRTVLLRLSRLHEEAAAVARAVAILGESSKLPTVAALTGLGEDAVARAAGDLARADILRPEPPLGFVHPLVRDAVYLDVPAGERELQHGRAADVLAAAQAAEEEIAAQLVHAPRRGDAQAVERLRAAARQAVRRGGPDNAMTYLVRALEEPPAPDLRPQIHFDLGLAAAETNAPLAVEHLASAYRDLTDPPARAMAAFALAQSQLFIGAAREGGALARRAAADLPAELADVRQMIESIELLSVFFDADPGVLDRLAHYRRAPEGDGLGAKMLAAASAFAWAAGGGPAREVEALMLASWEGGELLASGNGLTGRPCRWRRCCPRARTRRRSTRRSATLPIGAAACSGSRRPSCSRAPTCCWRPVTWSKARTPSGSRCRRRSCGARTRPPIRGRAAWPGSARS